MSARGEAGFEREEKESDYYVEVKQDDDTGRYETVCPIAACKRGITAMTEHGTMVALTDHMNREHPGRNH